MHAIGKDLSAKNVAKIQKLVHGNSERIMLLEKKNNVFRELLREHSKRIIFRKPTEGAEYD